VTLSDTAFNFQELFTRSEDLFPSKTKAISTKVRPAGEEERREEEFSALQHNAKIIHCFEKNERKHNHKHRGCGRAKVGWAKEKQPKSNDSHSSSEVPRLYTYFAPLVPLECHKPFAESLSVMGKETCDRHYHNATQ
jgi:hypothetical protein